MVGTISFDAAHEIGLIDCGSQGLGRIVHGIPINVVLTTLVLNRGFLRLVDERITYLPTARAHKTAMRLGRMIWLLNGGQVLGSLRGWLDRKGRKRCFESLATLGAKRGFDSGILGAHAAGGAKSGIHRFTLYDNGLTTECQLLERQQLP